MPTSYRVSVKREAPGAGSHYIAASCGSATSCRLGAPRGSFTLATGRGPVVLLSAGIGVTPGSCDAPRARR